MEEHLLKNAPTPRRQRALRSALSAAFRPALLTTGLPFALALAACSTVELPPASPVAGAGGAGAAMAGALAPSATPPGTLPPVALDEADGRPRAGLAAAAPASAPDDADADDASEADPAPAADAPAPAVLPPYDPLQPDTHVNLDDAQARTDLWKRVVAGFAIPDLDSPAVKEWEQWYSSRPDYVARMTARGSRYLYHITEEVEKRHMPTELALLPFTESAFNPQAMSVAKASGMWQFISSTGKDYDLTQNIFRDDRRDVLQSTRAALDYLQKLHDMFGDWQLALAAYNCGEGNVARAIARNQKKGLPTDYESLSLPAETRGYVPKLQAVKNIVLHPDAYGLALPALGNHPYFLSVPIERDVDVDTAARLAKVPIDEFRMLNPQLNKPVILAAGTPQVLLPYDNADDFVRAVEGHKGPLATWTAWVATKTMRPADAARQVGMSEAELRDVNHIPARMLVKAGSTLLVPRSASHTEDVSEQLAENAAMALAPDLPPTRRVNMRVARGGETVASVARRWHVAAADVAQWNHVSPTGKFSAGATAVLFIPRGATLARATPTRASTKVAARAPAKGKTAAGNARSGTHVAVSKAAHPVKAAAKASTKVVAKGGGGAATKSAAKTKARVAER